MHGIATESKGKAHCQLPHSCGDIKGWESYEMSAWQTVACDPRKSYVVFGTLQNVWYPRRYAVDFRCVRRFGTPQNVWYPRPLCLEGVTIVGFGTLQNVWYPRPAIEVIGQICGFGTTQNVCPADFTTKNAV